MWSLFNGASWRGYLSRGSLSGGVSIQEVSIATPGIRKADSMHPTGILSCLKNVFILFIYGIDYGHIENGFSINCELFLKIQIEDIGVFVGPLGVPLLLNELCCTCGLIQGTNYRQQIPT